MVRAVRIALSDRWVSFKDQLFLNMCIFIWVDIYLLLTLAISFEVILVYLQGATLFVRNLILGVYRLDLLDDCLGLLL